MAEFMGALGVGLLAYAGGILVGQVGIQAYIRFKKQLQEAAKEEAKDNV